MAKLVVHQDRIEDVEKLLGLCPFGALEESDGRVVIGDGCKMCRLCVKSGAVEYIEGETEEIDKSQWQGICVLAEQADSELHPVTLELLGKAEELAGKTNQPVYCLLMGEKVSGPAQELLHYGADRVYVYEAPALRCFSIEPCTAVLEDFIRRVHPSSILVGATPVGRQLAPRTAARFRTGLTADCTVLDILPNTDLVQIRPAFGGNIMAEICTPNHRPQMATVRYKVMDAPPRREAADGEIVRCSVGEDRLGSRAEVVEVHKKEKVSSIEHAGVLVAAGRGIRTREDLAMVEALADVLGGELAATRPMVEAGWVEPRRQIGLSGRTVRPKLIITCGVSGAVQFTAGMNHSETIFAINKDPDAPIFKVADYGAVGDIYEIIPALTEKIKAEGGVCHAV